MFLQWFPGHMTRAMRMMEEQVKLCDGIIYVLDARAPYACLNKKLNNIFENKPIVYVLNKVDLADDKLVKLTIKDFENQGKLVIALNGTLDKSAKPLYEIILLSLAQKLEKYKQKAIKRPLRVMVAGIPNTGKSTIINMLTGGKKARTGDKAGVTKDKQWVKINSLELLDTPGTTPPSFDNQKNAQFLAFIGSINDDILDFVELSYLLLGYLLKNYQLNLQSAYKIDTTGLSEIQIFESIAKKRGALMKGGEIDAERVGSIIINDLRKGKLGKITFICDNDEK